MPDATAHDISEPEPSAPTPAGRLKRRLPFGPVGLLGITALALGITFAVVALATRSNDSDSVNITDALTDIDAGPAVPAGTDTASEGDPAPDVRLDYLDGGSQQLAELRGAPVVLNFWSSTCAPCLQEMPAFEQVHDEFGDKVTIVGVDVTDTKESGEKMVQRTGVSYRNARDPQGSIFGVFGGIALPRTVVLDADGTVLSSRSGALSAAELTALLHDSGVS